MEYANAKLDGEEKIAQLDMLFMGILMKKEMLFVILVGEDSIAMRCYVKITAIIMVFVKMEDAFVKRINSKEKHAISKYVRITA